jgi:sensor domain CHASE-containing protein
MAGETSERPAGRGMAAVVLAFLFGIAVGYIVRDLRADEQVKQAAVEARRELEQSANTAIQRVQQVGAVLGQGVKATAESAKSAFSTPVAPKTDTAKAVEPAPTTKAAQTAPPKREVSRRPS